MLACSNVLSCDLLASSNVPLKYSVSGRDGGSGGCDSLALFVHSEFTMVPSTHASVMLRGLSLTQPSVGLVVLLLESSTIVLILPPRSKPLRTARAAGRAALTTPSQANMYAAVAHRWTSVLSAA